MDQEDRRRGHTRAPSPGHELSAEEEWEASRLMVNRCLAAEARDLETYRIVHGRLFCLFAVSYARWLLGHRRTVAQLCAQD